MNDSTRVKTMNKLKMMFSYFYNVLMKEKIKNGGRFTTYIKTDNGDFNGCYYISDTNNSGKYTYYLYENIAFSSIIRRKIPIDENVYLNNIHKIHRGTFMYSQDDEDKTEVLLTHYIDEFSRLKVDGIDYFNNGITRMDSI